MGGDRRLKKLSPLIELPVHLMQTIQDEDTEMDTDSTPATPDSQLLENKSDVETHTMTFEDRGRAAADKFAKYLLLLRDNFERYETSASPVPEEQLLTREVNGEIRMRRATLRHFTSLLSKLFELKAKRFVSMDGLAPVIKHIQLSCIRSSHINILEEFDQLRREKSDDTVKAHLNDLLAAIESAVFLFKLAVLDLKERDYLPDAVLDDALGLVFSQMLHLVTPLLDCKAGINVNANVQSFMTFTERLKWGENPLTTIIVCVIRVLRYAVPLIERKQIHEDVVTRMTYICLGAFFHNTPSSEDTQQTDESDRANMLKLTALDALRALFTRYHQDRRWIILEILSNLNSTSSLDDNKRYRLRSGKYVHARSALLLHLVQSCAMSPDPEDDRVYMKEWTIRENKKKDSDVVGYKMIEEELVTRAAELWRARAKEATSWTNCIIEYLMSKCTSRHSENDYHKSEYKKLLVDTMDDALAMLGDPEWPAAALFNRVYIHILNKRLFDTKTELYFKTLAIERFGIMACRIRSGMKCIARDQDYRAPEWLARIHRQLPSQIGPTTAPEYLELLAKCQTGLCIAMEDTIHSSVFQCYMIDWGTSLATLWDKLKHLKDDEYDALKATIKRTIHSYYSLWAYTPDDRSDLLNRLPHVDLPWSDTAYMMELLLSREALYHYYDWMVDILLQCLSKDNVSYRVRAMRALRHISKEIPEFLGNVKIKDLIVQRVHDGSPTVREIAIEILADHVCHLSDIPKSIYDIVSKRIMDASMTVRNRALRLLGHIYPICTDQDTRLDIACRVIQRIKDPEAQVCRLALKISQEILFQPLKEYENLHGIQTKQDRTGSHIDIIIGTAARLHSNGQTHLEDVISQTMQKSDDRTQLFYGGIFHWLQEALYARLDEYMGDDAISRRMFIQCLYTMRAITRSCPGSLSHDQLSYLHTHIIVTNSAEARRDREIISLILGVFIDVFPTIGSYDRQFIADLEKDILRLLSCGPLELMEDAVCCLNTVTHYTSHHYENLLRVFSQCIKKLQGFRAKLSQQTFDMATNITINKALYLVALICKHVDFYVNKDIQERYAELTKGDPFNTTYETLMAYSNTHWEAALQGLSYLCFAKPLLMIAPETTTLLDRLVDSDDDRAKSKVLLVCKDFLDSENDRIERADKGIGGIPKELTLGVLLGNTKEFAELSVNGTLAQRYLKKARQCALQVSSTLGRAGFAVINVILEQGLAHPLLCITPVIVAETSPDINHRNAAHALHKFAHDRYGRHIYSNLSESIQEAYHYHQQLTGGPDVPGCDMHGDAKLNAVLGLPYSLIKQNDVAKRKFLQALLKPFHLSVDEAEQNMPDINYLRFLADNLLYLHMTQTDEVLWVLHRIDQILATSGFGVLEHIQFLEAKGVFVSSTLNKTHMAAANMAMCMVLLMRVHECLKNAYCAKDSQIEDYTDKAKPRPIDREFDIELDWVDELTYFSKHRLTSETANDAIQKFISLYE
ncbi:sister chromatid cohesion C-terminus-domain-containing protein [Syncephalastrum racemosum]|uniref:Sister chromatid cohesion protein n=1 Tax=Syncephalastrum racemosum TaxID=13706 RepID=A0A1X2HWA6_SYNRA|nr:sister chromatid cohesion C-terminus-domain-containing protein [Syncephalastrum racemosum]